MNGEILEETGGYRVRLVQDPYPDMPYDDGQSPLLRTNLSRYSRNATHIQEGSMRPTSRDHLVESAATRWGPESREFALYLRLFFGVTQIEHYRSDDYVYTTYDSSAWREATGAPAGSADLSEWKSWVEGEVYYYVVEKSVPWVRADNEDGTMKTWEDVDSCGGYYGYAWAKEEAISALHSYTEQGE
jgi:hypothetical protein